MPDFARVAAYIVIDTFTLLIWHQMIMSRVSGESSNPSHLATLIHYYLSQCQPAPLPGLGERFLRKAEISVLDTASNDTIV